MRSPLTFVTVSAIVKISSETIWELSVSVIIRPLFHISLGVASGSLGVISRFQRITVRGQERFSSTSWPSYLSIMLERAQS